MLSFIKTRKGLTVLIIAAILSLAVGGLFVFKVSVQDISNSLAAILKGYRAISVQVTRDEGQTAAVSPDGGQISIADEIVLSIPADSILGSQTIVLSKIGSIQNLPQGAEFVTGIHLNAADLAIVKPVALTLPLPAGSESQEIYGFAYDGDGDNFRLYPVAVTGGFAEFKIFHASGYGVLMITDSKFKPYTPSDARARAEQKIALMGDYAGVTEVLQDWYHEGVKPKLAKALGNGDLILDAIHEYFAWRGFAQFFGVEDDLTSEIAEANEFITKALVNAYDKAVTVCVKEKDPSQVARLLKLAEIVQYLGREGVAGLNSEEMINKARNCASFTLKISSNFKYDADGLPFEEDYSGEILIAVDQNFGLSGTGKITLNKQIGWGNPCSVISGPSPYFEPWSVRNTNIKIAQGNPEITLALQMEEGDDVDDWRFRCYWESDMGGSVTEEGGFAWLPAFVEDNISLTNPNPVFYLSGWEIIGAGGVYARKIMDVDHPNPYGGPTVQEYTVFELIHTPKE